MSCCCLQKELKDKEKGGLSEWKSYHLARCMRADSPCGCIQGYDPKRGAYVTLDKDAVAVAAHNDLVAGRAEIRTIALMSGTEDVPELFVQLIFLLMEGKSVGLGFWIAAVGTLIHLMQRGFEGWVTLRNLSKLNLLAEGRDKTFERDARSW